MMKHSFRLSTVKLMTGLMLVGITCVVPTSCSDDDAEQIEMSKPFTEQYKGNLKTSLPAMPAFAPIVCAHEVSVLWNNQSRTSSQVSWGAFDLEVKEIGRTISIGAMTLSDVTCTPQSDGSILLVKEKFESQAGDYLLKGKMQGVYQNGKLKLTLTYFPGSMPFECQSEFESISLL